MCEALLRAVCPDDEIFIRQVLEFLALVKPRKSPPSPISAPPATIKEPSPKPQKASPPTTQHTEKYTQQIPANEPTKTHKTKSRRRITSVVLPTTDAQPPHQSSKSSTPSLEPTPQQKPAEKVVEEVASVTNALGALHLSEAPQQPVVQGTHETSSPQGMEAYEPFAKAPKYCVSYPPLLARRVNDQMRIARNTLDCGQKFDDAVAFHSYPIFLSQIIRANTPAKPWFSKTTGRVNEHHSCIGSICRYKDRLPPVVGYFGDCFDKNVLYHHFFKPLHQMPMIERYQTTGSFIDHTDLPTPPSEGRQQEGVFTPEVDTPERYVTQTRGLLFILDDTRAGIVYTAAFFNPVQVVS